MREGDTVTMQDAQTKVADELEQLCTQTAKKRPKCVEVHLAVRDDERPAEREVSRGSEKSVGAPSTAACSALLAESDEFKRRFKVVMFENQCIPGLAEKAKELRANVASIEKPKASTKSTPTKIKNKRRPTVAEKRVIALERDLQKARDAQKRSIDETKKSKKCATDAATQLTKSV